MASYLWWFCKPIRKVQFMSCVEDTLRTGWVDLGLSQVPAYTDGPHPSGFISLN